MRTHGVQTGSLSYQYKPMCIQKHLHLESTTGHHYASQLRVFFDHPWIAGILKLFVRKYVYFSVNMY